MQINCPRCQSPLAVNPADEFHICPSCRQTFRYGAAPLPEKKPPQVQHRYSPQPYGDSPHPERGAEFAPPTIRPTPPRRTSSGSSSGWGIGTVIVVILLARIPLRCAREFSDNNRHPPPPRIEFPDMPDYEHNMSSQRIQELLKSMRESKEKLEQLGEESPPADALLEEGEVPLPEFLTPPSLDPELMDEGESEPLESP